MSLCFIIDEELFWSLVDCGEKRYVVLNQNYDPHHGRTPKSKIIVIKLDNY